MSIKKRVMDLLAKRDHSEKELKQKLSRVKKWDNKKERLYSDEEIFSVVNWARDNRWLQEGGYLSERWAESLNRKKKGIKYINAYLAQKGLPAIKKNPEIEIEKAFLLLEKKLNNISLRKKLPQANASNETPLLEKEDKNKLTRFLLSRGFDSDIIQKCFLLIKAKKN